MAFTIDTSQLNALTAALVKSEAKVTAMAGLAVAKTALDLEASAKRPTKIFKHPTGPTMNSIGTDISGDRLSAEVGPTTNYSPYLEYGTSRMAAEPFMGPALDEVTPGFVSAMEQIGKGLL